MSQYKFVNARDREVIYGLDKPTGGYYYTEFFNTWETVNIDEDVVFKENALTLTELRSRLFSKYSYDASLINLLSDWRKELDPTELQFDISRMFGQNLGDKLNRTAKDVYSYDFEE